MGRHIRNYFWILLWTQETINWTGAWRTLNSLGYSDFCWVRTFIWNHIHHQIIVHWLMMPSRNCKLEKQKKYGTADQPGCARFHLFDNMYFSNKPGFV